MNRRTGDTVIIAGDYQYRAREDGFIVQRFWHHLKTEAIRRYAAPQPHWRVLDVGCGSGVITAFLATSAAEAIGVDANADAVRFARTRFPLPNVRFIEGLADDVGFSDASFDAIYSLELVEHLDREQAANTVRMFARLLRPGGTLLLTTPNYRSPWPVIEWTMDALRLAPRLDGHQHVWHPNPSTFRALVEGSELREVVVRRAFGLAPFVSVFGWTVATWVDRSETHIGNPLGSLLVGAWCRR